MYDSRGIFDALHDRYQVVCMIKDKTYTWDLVASTTREIH